MKISKCLFGLVFAVSILSCQKKADTATSAPNISTTVVTNLSTISSWNKLLLTTVMLVGQWTCSSRILIAIRTIQVILQR